MNRLFIAPGIELDPAEIHLSFARAPGPGGQNVNKVETAVKLHFDAAHSPSLPPAVKERLARLAGRRMTRDGVLVITAHRLRTQHQNRADALARLLNLLRRAAHVPAPRKATCPTAAARERRLERKRTRSLLKRQRSQVLTAD